MINMLHPVPHRNICGTSGKTFYLIVDHLFTPQEGIDSLYNIDWSFDYGAFGTIIQTATASKYRFRFPGQYWDDSSDLHYNLNRFYNATNGRYTSLDYLSTNNYLYPTNPIGKYDNLGLYEVVQGNISYSPYRGSINNARFAYGWLLSIDCICPSDNTWKLSIELVLSPHIYRRYNAATETHFHEVGHWLIWQQHFNELADYYRNIPELLIMEDASFSSKEECEAIKSSLLSNPDIKAELGRRHNQARHMFSYWHDQNLQDFGILDLGFIPYLTRWIFDNPF